jgi:hypothetical protein
MDACLKRGQKSVRRLGPDHIFALDAATNNPKSNYHTEVLQKFHYYVED